ncbi:MULTISPECIES: DNA-3-methyladenine glycosylase family protein [Eubacteriales]|uniref:DNA-(apurinic or apyrimidinic site) lyase n=1 Tax=Bittarella massiliensis (ex Durand et al. 2017) TaxID=1720313 RepID=A0AAQ1MDG8_9FIRM|nr:MULTISPECIES: DNA glycosylase [Eubacteriales]ERI98445.1 8-oxoguanine DNA-glycosylase [Clostridium sp. ATCC 29733]MZL69184.1 DNA-3-methyladenine glycosylase 2 family protein [Bittarella massiliensis (ex Durand et al. 2017)]MZL79810.1 DNA-3-methyladenine glycosylase 2 family protein [Bittarella massiliensis (ex Durand et al. 2017)]SHG14174.1 N-glycosylase/DNA lyase [Bittarella massiliensis (ex Durand et al. 2017)]
MSTELLLPSPAGLTARRQGDRLLLTGEEGEPPFSLEGTLQCGQCFGWWQDGEGWWQGVVGNTFCRAREEGDAVVFAGLRPGEEGAILSYFDWDRDYRAARELLCRNPVLRRAVAFAPGIRLLRQDPWEALCSFILSQNNNIPRIQKIVRALTALLGQPLAHPDAPGTVLHTFPTAERLARCTLEELAPIRAGFRAKYILDAARQVATGRLDLDAVAALPLEEARAALCQIRGVGPKVADCALLYGLGRWEVVPMDVWMKRAMAQLFPKGFPRYLRGYEGLAQQFLFHYCRLCPGALKSRAAGRAAGGTAPV